MRKSSVDKRKWDLLREKVIGLGEKSIRKNYYPELQKQVSELEQFKILLGQSNDLILLCRLPSGQIVYSNESASKYLNYSKSELNSFFLRELIAADWNKIADLFDSNEKNCGKINTEFCKREGDTLSIELSVKITILEKEKFAIIVGRDVTEWKQAEDNLKKSEKLYRSVIDNIIDVFYRTDANGLVTMASLSAAKMLQYDSVADLIGKRIESFWANPEERKKLIDKLDREHEVIDYSAEIITKTGKIVPIAVSCHYYHDEQGNKLGIEGVFRDISERRRAENALRASEAKFHSLYAHMVEGAALHQLVRDENMKVVNYKIIDVNPQFEEITNLLKENIIDKYATEVYKTDIPPYLDIYASVALSGKAVSFETYFIPMNKYFVISVSPLGNEGFATTFFDITERKRNEDQLKISNERLQMALEAGKQGIFEWTSNGSLFVSENIYKMLGFSSTDFSDPLTAAQQLLNPEDLCRVVAAVKEGVRCGKSVTVEYRVRDSSERWRWMEGRAYLIDLDEFGIPRRILGTITDITNRKELLVQLFHSEKLASIGMLAAGVAHEINNPLAILKGNISLMRDYIEPTLCEKFLNKQDRAVDRIAQIVNSLRTYARADNESLEAVNLHLTINEALSMIGPIFNKEKIEFVVKTNCKIPIIKGNVGKIHQIFMNLFSNARDAMIGKKSQPGPT